MRTPMFVVRFVLLSLCGLAAAPVPAVAAGPFDGSWDAGSSWGTITLRQEGSLVTGSYSCCGVGAIRGVATASTLRFSWQNGGGDTRRGEATITLLPDGDIEGNWCSDAGCDPTGKNAFRGERVSGGHTTPPGKSQPASSCDPSTRAFEFGFDRLGGDYRSFELDPPCPEICAYACRGDDQCVAWTFVNPGIQGPRARCWLKDRIPNPTRNDGMVSGTVTRTATPVFNGSWDAGSSWGTITLRQDGNTVTGSYSCCGVGSIRGVATASMLRFSWQNGGSDTRRGEATMTLLPDGDIEGNWCSEAGCDPAGRNAFRGRRK